MNGALVPTGIAIGTTDNVVETRDVITAEDVMSTARNAGISKFKVVTADGTPLLPNDFPVEGKLVVIVAYNEAATDVEEK